MRISLVLNLMNGHAYDLTTTVAKSDLKHSQGSRACWLQLVPVRQARRSKQ